MKTLAIGAFFVLFAIAVGVASPVAYADHPNAAVSIPSGTSVQGCEETDACYIPADVTVDVGGEVTWNNEDSAAHTVTSSIPEDNLAGADFDSGLFLAGTTFSWTPEEAGKYPYFCLVHPWMVGTVTVVAEDDHVMERSASGMLSDGTLVEVYADGIAEGEMTEIMVVFVDSEHVNYDLMVTQDGETVVNDVGAHEHSGEGTHRTAPLGSASPVDVTITFQGFGLPGSEFTGPVGEVVTFTSIVPEFGTMAVMILAVAIVSIVAVTARSRLSFVPRI